MPKCFDDWVYKEGGSYQTAAEMFYKLTTQLIAHKLSDELHEWVFWNKEVALKALQNGYEVEQAPQYHIKMDGQYITGITLGDKGEARTFKSKEEAEAYVDIVGGEVVEE
ncbi:hypothetical protein MFLO_15870 [Listeria floridensis FSL S10-1187]|uniref:DUF1642 domain-containing protein n=1 Tax=Listeria floridensis FSL S10-1187 TaxID=1265817 RepID=A0ABN0RBF0_9LIST|nr:DUF1642 domain-containing protein [Listeria floridensis]EUJ23492.1 hypothetical protein MFLO_15870 [Listeria floridensis FSL S10-1187]